MNTGISMIMGAFELSRSVSYHFSVARTAEVAS